LLCWHYQARAKEVGEEVVIRDLIKDLLKYLPAQIAPAVMGLITIPIITRLFPPADYGNYILVTATVSIFATFVGWLSMSIIRFYPVYEQDGRLPVIYGTVVRWLLVSVAVLAAIFLGIAFVVKNHLKTQLYYLMLIGTLLFVFTAVFEVLQQFLRSKRWAGLYSAFSIWKNVVGLLIGLGLAMGLGCGVEALLWGSVLSSIVALPFLWRSVLGKTRWKETNSVGLAREMAKYGFPLVVGNLAAWILSLSDRYVLEFFRGAQEVGIYSISYTISEKSIVLLTSLFMFASGPISMSVWEKEGVAKSQEFLTKLTRYYLIICLPIVVGLSVLARPVIDILTAPEYYQGFRIIPLVVLGGFFLGLQHRFQAGLKFYNKTNLIMINIIFAGLLNLVLNLWLVPKHGYVAAAVTTLVSYAFLLAMMVIISRKYFVWEFPLKSLGKVTLASLVMGAVIYLVGNSLASLALVNLIFSIFVGMVVYGLMLLLLREPQKEEIQALRLLCKRILKGVLR
jgi:O-antigen/teichoic acid export membrane protein